MEKKELREQLNGFLGDYSDLDMLTDFVLELLDKAELEILSQVKEIIERKSIYQEKGDECGTPIELIEWYVGTKLEDLTSKEEK